MAHYLHLLLLLYPGILLKVTSKGIPADRENINFPEHGKYNPLYREDPTLEELFANYDMDTPQAAWLRGLETLFFNGTFIDEVKEGAVYQGRGYSMGLPTVVVTPQDTLIVIDVPESAVAAQEILDDMSQFPAVGNKPVEAIIYTMYHGDHINGAGPFVERSLNGITPRILANEKLTSVDDYMDPFYSFKSLRGLRQFGSTFPDPYHINHVIVNRFRTEGPWGLTYPPNEPLKFDTVDTIVSTNIGGLEVQFVSIPGYSDDHIAVWIPQYSLAHAADAYYYAFPNTYAVRGEPWRDALKWQQGTRKVASFQAEYLTATHAKFIQGRELVHETLTNYADALQFVHDQTLRYMNKGYLPESIPPVVKLPQLQASRGYNKASYTNLEIAVRGIYGFYLGWFSGEVEDLFPVEKLERAQNMIEDFGVNAVKEAASRAYNEGKYRWALELATHLFRADPKNRLALEIRTEAMKRIAEPQTGVIPRNYLLTVILEDWKLSSTVMNTRPRFKGMEIDNVLLYLGFHVDAVKAEGKQRGLLLELSDLDSFFRLTLRNSVLDVNQVNRSSDDGMENTTEDVLMITTTSSTWKNILAGDETVDEASMTIKHGDLEDVREFLSFFDLNDGNPPGGSKPVNAASAVDLVYRKYPLFVVGILMVYVRAW